MSDRLTELIDLPEMVNRALATKELAPLLPESGLTAQQIIDEINPKMADFLSVAAESVVALQKADAELTAVRMEVEQREREIARAKPKQPWLVVGVIGVVACLGLLVSAVFYFPARAGVLEGSKYFDLGIAGFALTFLVFLLAVGRLGQWFSRRMRYRRALAQRIPQERVKPLEDEFARAREELRQQVYDRGVRMEVTVIMSQATTPLYGTQLGTGFTATGLAEVFVSGHEVETQARRDLDDLLRLPGGSIGLAGSRGAGKTTLMTLVARRPGPTGKACYVMCPAPVEYSGREFLLTLFLLLCNWVLEDRLPGGLKESTANPAREKPDSWWLESATLMLPRVTSYLMIAGLALFLSGLGLAYYFVHSSGQAHKPAQSMGQSTGQAAAKPGAAPGTGSTGAKPETATPANAKPEDEVPEAPTVRYLKLIGLEPARLVVWGLGLFVVAYAVRRLLLQTLVRRMTNVHFGGLEVDLRWAAQSFAELEKMEREAQFQQGDALTERAKALRESLRFQQSYTSGWSGSLKVPLGLEGGVNDARSYSRNQRSLPELVGEFRDFLRDVAVEYGRVTICIDELDKMESDDKAHLFLNEIKAVFGVPKAFFLISVSENAISAFERRGLPFRDVFDSSFDAIIHVDYLNLDESKDLLKRRTTRLPEPFLCLCHCMSGGLPRDLIRACREMLDLAQEEKEFDLLPLARRVMTRDARGKARGMSIAISKLTSDADQTAFLWGLTELLTTNLDETTLLVRAAATMVSADALRERAAKLPQTSDPSVREQVLQLSALAELEMEFGLYLGYAATVLEVMIDLQPRWLQAEAELAIDVAQRTATTTIDGYCNRLAGTRQALAVSAPVGRERLVKLRTELGMNVQGIALKV
jgi:hypothetical protein